MPSESPMPVLSSLKKCLHLRDVNANLHDISRSCLKAPGNVRDIILVQPEEIEVEPDYYFDPVVDNLTLKSGTRTYYLQQQLFTGRFRENKRNDRRSGDYHQQTLDLSIRKDRLEVKRSLIRMINAPVHILFSDYVGGWKWVRNMRVAHGFDTGSGINASQGYDLSFTSSSRKPTPWLVNTAPEGSDDPGSGPIIINQIGDGGTSPACDPTRVNIGVQTGGSFTLPAGVPTDDSRVFVYVEGSLLAWGRGLTRSGNICTLQPPLDAEFVEVIYF